MTYKVSGMIFLHIEEDLHDIQKLPPGQGKKIVQIEINTLKIEKETFAIGKKYHFILHPLPL